MRQVPGVCLEAVRRCGVKDCANCGHPADEHADDGCWRDGCGCREYREPKAEAITPPPCSCGWKLAPVKNPQDVGTYFVTRTCRNRECRTRTTFKAEPLVVNREVKRVGDSVVKMRADAFTVVRQEDARPRWYLEHGGRRHTIHAEDHREAVRTFRRVWDDFEPEEVEAMSS